MRDGINATGAESHRCSFCFHVGPPRDVAPQVDSYGDLRVRCRDSIACARRHIAHRGRFGGA